MKKPLLLLILALFGLASSCSKDEPKNTNTNTNNTNTTPTRKELLSKTWKVSEPYVNGQLSTDPEWQSIRYTINSNGTYSLISNSTNYNGTWEFNSDETKIFFDKGSSSEETHDIIELTSTKWKTKYTVGSDNIEVLFVPS